MGLDTAVELFKKEDGSSEMKDIIKDKPQSLGGEDFAFFSEVVPSVMYSIGHQSDDPATSNKYVVSRVRLLLPCGVSLR